MKRQYISPAAELICLIPAEELTNSTKKPWEWDSELQNYWGNTTSEIPSGNSFWYDFGTEELD